ncbi:type II secretion system major pseudopilin GspG [Sedimentisphaera salicampi]|uniref:Type II secretion system core protein G n=1 Tax=Sedimentisphaera salicampi TaxID=1941349 RepID=A0A1W6LPX2_9BACT|nr:type II secretion system major pseudopilin GspG [Sedimentisphaera salicampi]ARN57830.1 PilD-dependent protein PddA [Sedimentisphaera salicampi]OXU13998.1 PilD-dependent protein PddA [Sedimentisphaera salicampi]
MKKRKMNKGFSLVEVMAALIIIGLLTAIVAQNFLAQTDKARVKQTKANLKMLHNAVSQFKLDTGRYPSADEGLSVLVEEPADVQGWNPSGYLQTTDLPTDAWGNEFFYQEYPESGKPFVIISFGADGEAGGEGYDADLYSTDAN